MEDNQLDVGSTEAVADTATYFNTSTEEPEAPTEEEAIESTEAEGVENNSEEAEGEEPSAEEVESHYVDLTDYKDATIKVGDKEYTVSEIEENRLGGLRDKDYRQKTQKLAEGQKQIKAERDQLSVNAKALDSVWSEVEAFVSEWEPEKLDALKQKRDEALKASTVNHEQELGKSIAEFASTNVEWVDGGKFTPAFTEATSRMQKYMQDQGFTESDVQSLSPRMLSAIYDATRLGDMVAKNEAFKKKAKKLPVVTKPKPSKKSVAPKSMFSKSLADSKRL